MKPFVRYYTIRNVVLHRMQYVVETHEERRVYDTEHSAMVHAIACARKFDVPPQGERTHWRVIAGQRHWHVNMPRWAKVP